MLIVLFLNRFVYERERNIVIDIYLFENVYVLDKIKLNSIGC